MVAIMRNDIEDATAKKFGFGCHVKVLKHRVANGVNVILTVSLSMSYYTPTGRARMKPVYSYAVYTDYELVARFKVKSEATKLFKTLEIN